MKFKDAHEEYCSVLGGIMGSKEFEKACIKFVKDYTNKHMDKTDDKEPITEADVFCGLELQDTPEQQSSFEHKRF